MAHKKIAFITNGYPLDVSSMLINSVALLSEESDVDILVSPADERHDRCPVWMHKFFVYAPKTSKSIWWRAFRRLCYSTGQHCTPKNSKVGWLLKNLELIKFCIWLRRRIISKNYDMIIAVECLALIAVDWCGKLQQDLVYYNMELLDWAEKNPLYDDKLALKRLEYSALDKVTHVMITSESRAHFFAKINNFPLCKISTLPVVPRKSSFAYGSTYFRDTFCIPENMHLIVYSGNFMPWALCLEIIESVNSWPDNAVLIMHTWNESSLRSEYFSQMQKAAHDLPVYFSTKYLAYEDLPSALSSADVGLLYYADIDANFTDIMFSSNKLGEYMAAGIPVICSPFSSLQNFVDSHGIGKAVPLNDIGKAIEQILASIDEHRARVDACRHAYFDFDRYFRMAFSTDKNMI